MHTPTSCVRGARRAVRLQPVRFGGRAATNERTQQADLLCCLFSEGIFCFVKWEDDSRHKAHHKHDTVAKKASDFTLLRG